MADEEGYSESQEPGSGGGKFSRFFHEVPTWAWWSMAAAALVVVLIRLHKGSSSSGGTATAPVALDTSAGVATSAGNVQGAGQGTTIMQIQEDPQLFALEQQQIAQNASLIAELQQIINGHQSGSLGGYPPVVYPPIHLPGGGTYYHGSDGYGRSWDTETSPPPSVVGAGSTGTFNNNIHPIRATSPAGAVAENPPHDPSERYNPTFSPIGIPAHSVIGMPSLIQK